MDGGTRTAAVPDPWHQSVHREQPDLEHPLERGPPARDDHVAQASGESATNPWANFLATAPSKTNKCPVGAQTWISNSTIHRERADRPAAAAAGPPGGGGGPPQGFLAARPPPLDHKIWDLGVRHPRNMDILDGNSNNYEIRHARMLDVATMQCPDASWREV